MKFNLREFFEELLDIIEDTNDYETKAKHLEEYILDQAEYARDCKVID